MSIEETLLQKLNQTIKALEEFKNRFDKLEAIILGKEGRAGLDEEIRMNTKLRNKIEGEKIIEQVERNTVVIRNVVKFVWIVVSVFVVQTVGFVFFIINYLTTK